MNETLQEQTEKTYNLIVQANNQMLEIWKNDVLFTWQWWLGVGLTIIPWLLWIKYRKKDSTIRLLSAGFFVILISSWLDCLGVVLGLWYYVYEVFPFIPSYFPWDFSLLPVIIMVFIQIKPTTHPLIKGITFSGISSFLAEPFFIGIGLYRLLNWEHIYSFPIYIVIYLMADYISKRKTWDKV
ncbi:CBO0543 family protein [Alkalihalobacillus deserti]|uniref:CBO0543 family protein n=1 Tax=Alkalihalobacillus deserti TaxID=2879466 RepID=UPI001D14FE25|nr:CBO0543 family protein [Alkalihalobacillus deserti]